MEFDHRLLGRLRSSRRPIRPENLASRRGDAEVLRARLLRLEKQGLVARAGDGFLWVGS